MVDAKLVPLYAGTFRRGFVRALVLAHQDRHLQRQPGIEAFEGLRQGLAVRLPPKLELRLVGEGLHGAAKSSSTATPRA